MGFFKKKKNRRFYLLMALTFFNKKRFILDYSGKSLAIFIKEDFIEINNSLIKNLKKLSLKNNNCNLRVCLHRNKKDKLHNMIVLLNKDSGINFSTHKHKNKDEIYQIIEGSIKISVFKNKEVIKKIILSKKKNFITRINKNKYHKVQPLKKFAIFHEVREGPFLKGDSIFLK